MKADRQRYIYDAVTVTLIFVSTGHEGQLFAERESGAWWWLGYVMAAALDAVMVLSLSQTARARCWDRNRIAPLAVFLLACAVSGGFNYQYYRQNYPADPAWISVALGTSAPVLAALMSVLRALMAGTVEETEQKAQEAARQQELDHELELERIRQAEETKRKIAVGTAKEMTAQERARARRAQAEATQRKAQEAERQRAETARKQIESLGIYRETFEYFKDNPAATNATAAQVLGKSTRTIGNHLAHLEAAQIIKRNGSGVEVLEQAELEKEKRENG